MTSFLEDVLFEVSKQREINEDLIFVLPSKRAGAFLKNTLAKTTRKTQFLPDILSIESFVEKIAQLQYASNTEQLFQLYSVYRDSSIREKDNFYNFSKWAPTLLQDFNEIDRYLIDQKKIFSYLSDIQEINHWYLQAEKTKMMENYIYFWNHIEELYHAFNQALLKKGLGHQGLVYRQATQQLDSYIERTKQKTHLFIGFNALNTAETYIIQQLLEKTNADIYWDTDAYFLNDPIHDAGFFIRQHFKEWPYLKGKTPHLFTSHYLSKKQIQIIGVPKNVSQTKYVGSLLKNLFAQDKQMLNHAAVVLGDENLLNPLLNSIPEEVSPINITMGYPLNKIPLASFFSQFIALYGQRNAEGWSHKDVVSLLSHPYTHILLKQPQQNIALSLIEKINSKNWFHLTIEKINTLFPEHKTCLGQLFFNDTPSPLVLIEKCQQLTLALKAQIEPHEDPLVLEYLYRFYTLFNSLKEMLQKYDFITDLNSLQSLYRELLSVETLDFQGEPLQGLQIMGMLESRNLDFETVILTSVNEGILPSGKTNNSFIPYDIKKMFGLPTYKEKDAVYTYHFYRLLQRAKNIYILYNTVPDVLEGREKSRLIHQLLTDENKLPDITQILAVPEIHPTIKTPASIAKSEDLMVMIHSCAASGFSPTSLTNYIRNPIDFYKRTILQIDDVNEIEETVAANTFGTIVHDTLEALYQPFLGEILSPEKLTALQPQIKPLVKHHFAKSYADGDISRGRNLIAYQVVVKYIENFIHLEIEEAQNHEIRLLGLEEKLNVSLTIPEIDFPVVLKGKLDRIDTKDGVLRIIDYKTGTAKRSQVEVYDWDTLITDYESAKAFQLLCYALMYHKRSKPSVMQAAIISFKNLSLGPLMFATKEQKGTSRKNELIDEATLALFDSKLKALILEICNPALPFLEKEIN